VKKGFAYLAVLVLLSALLAAAGFFAYSLTRWRQIIQSDEAALRAAQMAESAAVYFQSQAPPLAQNNLGKIDRGVLLILEGLDWREDDLGFRIAQNKNTVYFIGYAGQLPEPQALKILYTTAGGRPKPWRE
jgi:type II secretory pathway pseudopilin PulG